MDIARREVMKLLMAGSLAPLAAAAQNGDDVLRLIVPFPAGSLTDVLARLFAETLHEAAGRTLIVDNKPGASGVIGSQEVSRAKPDGKTLLYATGGHTTNAAVLRKLPYDSLTGFTPITLLARSPGFGLIVSTGSGFQNLAQFVAAAKANPGRYTYGSAGTGGSSHLFGALFSKAAGIELLHVPYRAVPINELIAGTVDVIFTVPAVVLPYVKAGQMRVLATSADARSPQLPGVPTFRELGMEVQQVSAWNGIFGPPGMPPDIVDSVFQDIQKGVARLDYRKRLAEFDAEAVAMPPAQFREYVASEIARYKRVIPPLHIQLD